jgi:hypothetical protein
MILDHWFWTLLMVACLLWYSTITVYVAVKGCFDIREMLDQLAKIKTENETDKG